MLSELGRANGKDRRSWGGRVVLRRVCDRRVGKRGGVSVGSLCGSGGISEQGLVATAVESFWELNGGLEVVWKVASPAVYRSGGGAV
eukprot:COSAG02_NODE_666_length_18722_cov_237.372765_3_plen_87_part_00